MVNKIAFINGKGGCGKTTSIFHVAGVLSKNGEKVLVIDFDKQRNTSDILLLNSEYPEKTVFDFSAMTMKTSRPESFTVSVPATFDGKTENMEITFSYDTNSGVWLLNSPIY